ncbi:MAG: methyl-accepting chemotaxis protein, partial [Cyanobacteria bacterium J06600_6]
NLQTNVKQFLAYAPAKTEPGLPKLNWQAIVATDQAIVYAPQRKLRLVLILGSAVVAVGVGAIAYALAERLIRPILEAATAVQEIGRGNFTAHLEIPGTDEIAQLGSDINGMATQLADFVQVQNILTQQSQSLKDIALQLTHAADDESVFTAVVEVSCQTLKAQRAVYYQIEEQGATAIAESLADGQTAIKNSRLDPELVAEYQGRETLGEVEAINNSSKTNGNPLLQAYFQSLKLKSCLIAPVIVEDQLYGLLMVHQSLMPLPWLDEEVEFLAQVASQTSFAITRLRLTEQQRQSEQREKSAKEAMQMRALNLLQEVYDVSEGNLTIRAKVTEDEIGTIADSYNATIESLQNLVRQTKEAATEVQFNTTANNSAVQSLAEEAVAQAGAISSMHKQIEEMEKSIDLVANQACQAEEFVQQATTTIAKEDRAMNRTVAEIKAVQQTVVETATKAEKLGESSQEISQAVNLVGRFAAQTHLLALKASIEAARAGEQGKGFAVIADEVRSLATQSAEATAEIETLVSKIQLETGEVVEAMHQGAAQIASGNELVQQTRQSLTQVNQVSNEISQLVSSITQATQQQSLTSAQVSQTIVDVAAIAEHNSQSATQVSSDLRLLSAIADKLQSNIAKFTT